MRNLYVEYINLENLIPYSGNAKQHPQKQIEQIKESIRQFGMIDPIAVWGENNLIVEGHGRYFACLELGIDKAPIIRLDHLTDEQRRAYTLIHNKLTMNSGFDLDTLNAELSEINSLEMESFGFLPEIEIPPEITEKAKETENEADTINDRKRSAVICPKCGEYIEC